MKKPRSLSSFLGVFSNYVLDTIFPISCCVCSKSGQWVCKKCIQELKYNSSNFCLHCYTQNDLGCFCGAVKKNWDLDGIIIAGNYKNKNLKKIIKTYKYKSIKALAQNLFLYLNEYIENNQATKNFLKKLNNQNTLLISVPLHKKRQALRGFNQAELICKLLAKKYNLFLDQKNLSRKKNNPPQAKIKGKARLKNLEKNFTWKGKSLNNKVIILFDDICTTGTTLNECAKILKKAGAKEVWGLAIAKG